MRAQTLNAATKLVASTLACTVQRVQGYYKAAADAWLQIHDSVGEPAAGAVPVKSYALSYNAPYHWGFDPASLPLYKGCFVAVSSTEGTYTTVAYSAGATYLDIMVDYGPFDFKKTGFSQAGDLTTGVDSINPWNDGTVGFLNQIDYTNGEATDMYLMLFGNENAVDGDRPMKVWGPVAAGDSLALTFGHGGLSPVQIAGLGAGNGTEYTGCLLVQSTNPETLDTASNTSSSNLRAYYRTL